MFVKQYGCGPEIYFCLHGWSGDHRSFEPLVRYLPDSATLYSADLPGVGGSAAPRDWNLAAITAEICGAFDSLPATGITLAGNCIGALLGMRAAIRKPDLVRRLVLIDAFARWPWYFRVFTARRWGHYAYATTFANPVGRWITNEALAGKRSGNSDLTEGFGKTRHRVALQYLHVVRELTSVQEFAALRVPVDVVFGQRTFREVKDSAKTWQELWSARGIPVRVWELPGTGHLVLQEAAARVSEIVFAGEECQPVSVPTLNTTRP